MSSAILRVSFSARISVFLSLYVCCPSLFGLFAVPKLYLVRIDAIAASA
jgi:hypothetical protein